MMESDDEIGKQQRGASAAAVKARRQLLKAVAKKGIPPLGNALVEGETRVERRAKQRALRSSLVEELRAEMGQKPECVTDRRGTNAKRRRVDAQRRFEEAHFVRLSGGERKRRRLDKGSDPNDDGDLQNLLNFGRYRLGNDEKATTIRPEFRTPKGQKRTGRNDKNGREKKKGKKKGKGKFHAKKGEKRRRKSYQNKRKN